MPALGNWWKKFTRESISGQKPLFWIPEGKNKYKIHYTVEWFITISIAVLAEIIIRAFPARQHYFYLQDPDISYPILPELVTGSFLFIYSVAMPLLVILFISIAVVTSVHDMHHGILGLLQSCAVSYLVTNSIKLYLGGMRPCFLEICDPDPNMLETAPKYGYNGLFYDTSVCMGDQSDVKDAQFGFASGHACIAAAGMTFLSLYLHAKCKTFNERGSLWTYLLVLLSHLELSWLDSLELWTNTTLDTKCLWAQLLEYS